MHDKHFIKEFDFEMANLYYMKILYQTVLTQAYITYRLQLSSWTLHKGGLQCTVVNVSLIF